MPDRITALIASGDEAGQLQLYIEPFHKGVTCAFNMHGMCSIYPVRPIVCRVAHALDAADYCRSDNRDGLLPARLSFVPLEQFISPARSVILAAHHAMGGPSGTPTILCKAVYRLLASNHPHPGSATAHTPPSAPEDSASCVCDSTSPVCVSQAAPREEAGMASCTEEAD